MKLGGSAAALRRGRQLYNNRCYFCHGYNGDARTLAARYLSPPPADFTRRTGLTTKRIATVIRDGLKGTAMRSFRGLLTDAQISDLAAFVVDRFVRRNAVNSAYHTAENGWPDHDKRFGVAFPFVLGDISPSTSESALTERQRMGLEIFRDGCISCHDQLEGSPTKSWKIVPDQTLASVPRQPTAAEHDDGSYDRESSSRHDKAPVLPDLTAVEAVGERLYQESCAYCHAGDGSGENWIGEFLRPHPTNFTDPRQTAKLSDLHLRDAIIHGLPGTSMPAFQSAFDKSQVDSLIAYMKKAFFGAAQR